MLIVIAFRKTPELEVQVPELGKGYSSQDIKTQV